VTAGHFDRYRSERAALRHRKTVYCESVIIKQFLKWAKSRKLVAENPLADVKLDKPKLELHPGPSLEQVNLILAKAAGPLRNMLSVLAFTGMRSGELMRLKPEDVDLAGDWVHIVSREGAETKNHSSRKVPLHPRLRAVLEAMPKGERTWAFATEPEKKLAEGGGPINAKQLNQQFVALAKSIGLPTGRKAKGFVVHSLRHFFETFCINSGVPQRAVDVWMGHAPDKSMAAVYYELKDEESQAFMNKVPFGAGPPAADAGKEETK
jgi:integrase